MKIGHTMPELQPFTFHEKFVAHPVYNLQNPYLGLGNGRRYWGGGGIGRGGMGGGGATVPKI